MTMIGSKIAELIIRHLDKTITPDEQQELDNWKDVNPEHRRLFDELTNEGLVQQQIEQLDKYDEDAGWQKLQNRVPLLKGTSLYPQTAWRTFTIAASVVLLLSVFSYLLFNHSGTSIVKAPHQPSQAIKILPGGNKATLTLANGSMIALDEVKDGMLAGQGNSSVVKVKDGELEYRKSDNRISEIAYNTLATPKGGQYQLHLPDETRVWVNSASSIKYPTTFGQERIVEITGEVYFEVAKDPARPFKVRINAASSGSNRGEVEVLGTHFNIMAYDEESIVKTTLLEGKVKITKTGSSINQFLVPGQQSEFSNKEINIIQDADTEQSIAWMKGFTIFKNADIQTIMRQVARWYNVEVSYEGAVSNKRYSGEFNRQDNANEILEILEFAGMHFRIEKVDGNSARIFVIP